MPCQYVQLGSVENHISGDENSPQLYLFSLYTIDVKIMRLGISTPYLDIITTDKISARQISVLYQSVSLAKLEMFPAQSWG